MTASRCLGVALLLLGCATGPRTRVTSLHPPARQSRAGASSRSAGPAPVPSSTDPKQPPTVVRAVDTASALVGSRDIVVDGVDYGSDCAALVRAAFARAGHPFPPDARDVRGMLAVASDRGAVQAGRSALPGDLVFLADHPGGPAAHVALVARAEPDGTLTVLHRVSRGVRRVRMNLAYPERITDPSTGKHINDVLTVESRQEPAGRLVVAVSDLLRRG